MGQVQKHLLTIKNALFHEGHIRNASPNYVLKNPIPRFQVCLPGTGAAFWGILGPQKSTFLDIAASKYIPEPPKSRLYPEISTPSEDVKQLSFKESSGLDKVHLSARYESYSYKGVLEMSDDVNSVKNFITGANNYNSNYSDSLSERVVERVMNLFGLQVLKDKWINSLSNGQMRRARIAKALISRPKLLIIDDPFLGLDPKATSSVSESLEKFAKELETSIIIGLRVQDNIPSWITHIAYVDESGLVFSGRKDDVKREAMKYLSRGKGAQVTEKRSHLEEIESLIASSLVTDPIIEFENASVTYRGQSILKNFNWRIERGSNWRILGDNGTGKTTILSLITADHPQSWLSVIKNNGVMRKSGSGINYFAINNQIGITSPEIHALVPATMSMYEVIMNGLVPEVGNSNFKFLYKGGDPKVGGFPEFVLREFGEHISDSKNISFGSLTISQQKLALFLRAIIKNPDILILDEAFSCMDDEALVMKCHRFVLQLMRSATILTVGHIDWEVPMTDFTLQLLGGEHCHYKFYKNEL